MSRPGGYLRSVLARWPAWAWAALALVALGFVWRLWLTPRYFGWEESDYGNLAMARGVLESRFTTYDMNHLPLYYGLSALVLAVVGDAVVATHTVSMVSGLCVIGLVVWLGWRLGGASAAWLGGLLVVFQPELALYSASSLREPLYAAMILASLALAGRERLVAAAIFSILAFLTRFDALLVLVPALLLHAVGRGPRGRRLAAVALPVAIGVLAWSAYCRGMYGTWRFWEHSVTINLETGASEEAVTRWEWLRNGLAVDGALLFQVIPAHLGVGLALAAVLALPLLLWKGHGLARTAGAAGVLLTGFWLGIGLTAQHDPGHNLYWKWLLPLVPLWALSAGAGLGWLWVRLKGWLGEPGAWGLVLAVVAVGWVQQLDETRRQLEVSKALYAPQLALAREIEAEIPEDWPMVVDNIPGCWINRRPNERPLWTWMDVPVAEGGAEGFGRWLIAEDIRRVLWFREEWTQAPVVAPWLSGGGVVRLGGVVLREIGREEEYGWIWYA
ncbi:MAG: hypothetical protein ABIO70_29190, partial [Pseudomonadota bacterium]